MTSLFCAVLLCVGGGPDILLITVDTLRADHLGCYGYVPATSPNIDRLASRALVFNDCACEVPLTTPSFGAMFSSRYPRMTGVTKNGLRMPEDIPLMTEVLKHAGYQTVCIQSNWPLKQKIGGLHRGFDVYDDAFKAKRWGFMLPERRADKVTESALLQLRERDPAKPFFFWVHYSDPHAPYKFHKDFNPHGLKILSNKSKERVCAKYDSEIAYMDSYVGRLLAEVPETTLVVFSADHGESLYEHGYLGHGRRIYQNNEHVPLFFAGPGIVPGRSDYPACVLDIAPTVLGLAGISHPPTMLGQDLMKPQSADRVRFIETYGGAVPRIPGVHQFLADRHPMRQGLLCKGWKFITGGGQGPELYYLPEDPGELKNLADAEPGRVADYLARIAAWSKEHPKAQEHAASLSPEDEEALESLGYLK